LSHARKRKKIDTEKFQETRFNKKNWEVWKMQTDQALFKGQHGSETTPMKRRVLKRDASIQERIKVP
jgi:hypothetical protein